MDTRGWPQGLLDVAAVIGPESTLELARRCGGVPYHIPKTAHAGHPFAPIIGMAAMAKLCKVYGGDRLTLPRGCFLDPARPHVERMVAEGGQSRRTIALALGVTERYVRKVANSEQDDGGQLRLPL